MLETFLDKLKPSISRTQPSIIFVTGTDNYGELPQGFFNVECASGKKSLGYNGSFLCWEVGSTVVDGGKRIAAPENRADLPTVRLNFQQTTAGAQHVGGQTLIETDSMPGEFDGNFQYEPLR
jgi:hypothetical protein